MNKIQRLLVIFFLLLSPYALGSTFTRVNSLNQLPGAFKSKEGLARFHERKSGIPVPDGFGTTLPSGVSAKEIVQLIAPDEDHALATLVGMKAWPHAANTYIAIACIASSREKYERDMQDSGGKPTCQASREKSSQSYQPKSVYLAVLEYQSNGMTPKVIASYGKPLDIKINWRNSNLDAPSIAHSIEKYTRFDFSPFKTAVNETAFGIRIGWTGKDPEENPEEDADYQALMLFTQSGNKIINILSEPIYYSNNAAEHGSDRTTYKLQEAENIVLVLPHVTNGHFDLQLKSLHGKWKQLFTWNKENMRYQLAYSSNKPYFTSELGSMEGIPIFKANQNIQALAEPAVGAPIVKGLVIKKGKSFKSVQDQFQVFDPIRVVVDEDMTVEVTDYGNIRHLSRDNYYSSGKPIQLHLRVGDKVNTLLPRPEAGEIFEVGDHIYEAECLFCLGVRYSSTWWIKVVQGNKTGWIPVDAAVDVVDRQF
jgi:hypothetical protein